MSIVYLALVSSQSFALTKSTQVYKTVGNVDLSLHLFFPEGHKISEPKPALIFFHGGGWVDGTPEQFFRQSEYFAKLGLVAISVEYRLKKKHHATPKQSVFDARSAIRYIKKNASTLGINPENLIVGGGSAGGHLALSTALINFDDPLDDVTISTRPYALILFNPIIDTSELGYGYNRVKTYWKSFSPLHNISSKLPPTLIMLGTDDNLVPVSTAKRFQKKCKAVGSTCQLVLYPDELHGFFNHSKYVETLTASQKFLTELAVLKDG